MTVANHTQAYLIEVIKRLPHDPTAEQAAELTPASHRLRAQGRR